MMNVKMNFELYLKFYKISKLKMGQKQTKQALEYYIPTKKNFKLSYCVQENVSEVAEKKEYINLVVVENIVFYWRFSTTNLKKLVCND